MKKTKDNFVTGLAIGYQWLANGFKVKVIDGADYRLVYPLKVFKRFPVEAKHFLVDNFVYARMRPLTLYGYGPLFFKTGRPTWQSFIDDGIIKDLPCIGDLNQLPIGGLIADFKSANRSLIFFSQQAAAPLPPIKTLANRAVLALSFGKDSLLSYGLAKELGLNYLLVTGNEMESEMGDEWKIKRKIISSFCRQEKERVHFFKDNVDELFYHPQISKKLKEADDTNSMLAYAIEFLPFIYWQRAKYLIVGNERNLNDFFINQDGFRVYPAYDQSTAYTSSSNRYWSKFTHKSFEVVSFLEPLYNLAEMKILFSRYPRLLQYLMSCAPEKGSKERWCYHCPMCAKAFLYSAAVGGDPKKIAFNRNFFEKKHSEFYPLFAKKKLRHYERPPQVKEEQMLSFLLCYRRGLKGHLIDLFKKRYLTEAINKEKSFRKRYFGIQPAVNLPEPLKSKILKIYRRELSSLK